MRLKEICFKRKRVQITMEYLLVQNITFFYLFIYILKWAFCNIGTPEMGKVWKLHNLIIKRFYLPRIGIILIKQDS